MTPPRLPRDFPHRHVVVPGWAVFFHAPRHIVRIDIDKSWEAGTHGWQVRYGPRPHRFFSDAKGAKLRSPHASLKEAVMHLRTIYVGPRARVRTEPTSRKLNPIQEAGVRLVKRKRVRKNGQTLVEVLIEAAPPSRKFSPERFYAGTERTVTPERIEVAIEKARAARIAMVADHLNEQLRRGYI